MRLYSFPYYIDLEGKVINGIELKQYHVKLLGVLTVHDKFGNGCFASTKLLAEEAKLTEGTVRHARSELAKAGIINVTYSNDSKVESIIVNDVIFEGRSHELTDGGVNHSSHGCEPQFTGGVNHSSSLNREATPVLNKILNKNNKVLACGSDDIKDRKDVSPFDENVNEVVSLKPKNKNRQNAQAWAVAKEMVEIMKHDEREARVTGVGKNVTSLMNQGYTRSDFIVLAEWARTNEFYKDKPLRTVLNADAMQQAVLAKSKAQSSNVNQDRAGMFEDWSW